MNNTSINLKLVLFGLLSFASSMVFGCLQPENQKFLGNYKALFALGGDCQLAWQLRLNKLRDTALPFDSLVAPCDSVSQALEQKFDHFLERGNLEAVKNAEGRIIHILDTKYNVRFIHDFALSENFLKDYECIKNKYDERVLRLLEMIKVHQEKKELVLCIRKTINKQEAFRLHAVLNSLFPSKHALLALDTTKEIKSDWQIPQTHNCYLSQTEPYNWEGDTNAWRTILMAQGLTLDQIPQK